MGKKRPKSRRTVLRLRDLDHSKATVLNSLGSPGSRRAYEFAIEEFIEWYCSEPRLAFNRVVVTRYRVHLEERGLAAASVNQRLAAVRRLAYEAPDAGLLSTRSPANGTAQFWLSCSVAAHIYRPRIIPLRRFYRGVPPEKMDMLQLAAAI